MNTSSQPPGRWAIRQRVEEWQRAQLEDPRHSQRVAALLGSALGVSFLVCFATGLYSHIQQHSPEWFEPFGRPAGLYRITQGVHVATGLVSVPLLLAKLWSQFPKLFVWPPFRSTRMAVERALLVVLVSSSLFLLVSGVQNVYLWYPFDYYFPSVHYAVAWVAMGALIVHIGSVATVLRHQMRREARATERPDTTRERRRFLGFVTGAAGAVTLATVGQTLRPLSRVSLLAPRRPDIGPQGLPVNRTAAAAAVKNADPSVYRLRITGNVEAERTLSLTELQALPQRTATLPIACVEGWSANATWTGVALRDLLELVNVEPSAVRVVSLQTQGRYRTSEISASLAADPDTLLALQINGEPLVADHGAPVRLIAPNRPGVMQTKWIGEVFVL